MEDLPSEFDVIVIGTGLAESIVSAAVSRIGEKVLHLDPRDFYGGKWTTLNWDTLGAGIFADPHLEEATFPGDTNDFFWQNPIRELEQNWYVQDGDKSLQVKNLSRKFNIDVYPKILQAREDIIELLISSNVSRYLEFSCMTRLCANLLPPSDHVLERIPLSRSDIFTTKSIGLIDKRRLTKFIEAVLEEAEPNENNDGEPTRKKTFQELAQEANLNEKITHLLRTAVTTVQDRFEPDCLNAEFVERFKLFLQSINRYGNKTPYLWTLYGTGEICQAFCRLSAIYGGTFILKRTLQNLRLTDEGVAVGLGNIEITSKYLVLGSETRHIETYDVGEVRTLVRAVLVTTGGPVQTSEEDDNNPAMSVYKINDFEIIEADHSSQVAPKPYRLVHVTGPLKPGVSLSPRRVIESVMEPFLDFSGKLPDDPDLVKQETNTVSEEESVMTEPTVDEQPTASTGGGDSLHENILPNSKPVVLHGSYFLIDFHENKKCTENASAGGWQDKIFYSTSTDTEIASEINRAREIFQKMYPQEEFLPKASDGVEPGNDTDDNPAEWEEQEPESPANNVIAEPIYEQPNGSVSGSASGSISYSGTRSTEDEHER